MSKTAFSVFETNETKYKHFQSEGRGAKPRLKKTICLWRTEATFRKIKKTFGANEMISMVTGKNAACITEESSTMTLRRTIVELKENEMFKDQRLTKNEINNLEAHP